MHKIISAQIVILAFVFSALAQNVVPAEPQLKFPVWSAPAPRMKASTPFSPKPTKGSNIFDGEKEQWLADAVIKIGGGYLVAIDDKEVSDYISALGANLALYSAAPGRHYQFTVVNDEEENAFSIGAGRIYIDLGMLKAVESEDELVGVLGHEIGHDAFGHGPKTITRQLFWMTGVTRVKTAGEVEKDVHDLLAAYKKNSFAEIGENLLGWSRNDELQADKAGFYNIYKAGYNPEAMKSVFRRYVAKEKKSSDYESEYFLTLLFGSHPPSSQRVTALKWESNWIKMSPKDERYKNTAFDAMKARVAMM